jgi:hypothetical protein
LAFKLSLTNFCARSAPTATAGVLLVTHNNSQVFAGCTVDSAFRNNLMVHSDA